MKIPDTLSARDLLSLSYRELGVRFQAPRWRFMKSIHTELVAEEGASGGRGWFCCYPEFRVLRIGQRLWAVAIGSVMDTATPEEAFRVEGALVAVPFGLRTGFPSIAAGLRRVLPNGGVLGWGLVFSRQNGTLAVPNFETYFGQAVAMRVAPIKSPYETCGPVPDVRDVSELVRVPMHYRPGFVPIFANVLIDVLRGF